MNPSFFHRRVLNPVLSLLRQGVTPEKIALSIIIGVTLGVFPALGSTTLLCAGAALLFRLNLPAIQLVNYAIYPLQLGLLIPFIRLGERIFHEPHIPLSLAQLIARIHANTWQVIQDLWVTTIHAIVAWAVVMLPAALLFYIVLTPLLRWLWKSQFLSMNKETVLDPDQ